MAVIYRVEKSRDYTVISNFHLKDMSLSLKSKGLLSMILSLPDDWDYSVRGLAKICKEGVDCIGATLRELEKCGYLTRIQKRKNGKITDTEYTFYEKPQPKAGKSDENNNPDTEKSYTDKPHTENPYMGNSDMENSDTENPAQLNTNKSNTKELNTDCIKYQSINNGAPDGSADWIDRYNKINSEVKEQIEYDALICSNNAELVNDILSVMTEVLLVDTPYYTIEGKQIPTELVRINYRKITYNRLEVFLLDFTRLYDEIKNPKRYLITALYNIASTAETSITNRVNRDLYGG